MVLTFELMKKGYGFRETGNKTYEIFDGKGALGHVNMASNELLFDGFNSFGDKNFADIVKKYLPKEYILKIIPEHLI